MRKNIFQNFAVWVALVSLAQGLGLGLRSALAEDAVHIGTVDMQKALQTVEAGKKAKAQLEKDFNAKKKELQAEEGQIRKATDEFKKQSLVMSDEARAKKQAELQDRIVKFQELTARSQMEIQQKEKELTQPIVVKIKGIIADIAKKRSFTVVLEKNDNNVLYSLEKDDITTEVIGIFDTQAKSTTQGSG
jgi:outer membrane protein